MASYLRSETASYLSAASGEMAKLAEDAGLETLAHLFRMAELEAKEAQSGPFMTVRMHRAMPHIHR